MEEKIVSILNEMAEYLSLAQMKKLQEVILKNLSENEAQKVDIANLDFLEMFLDAKKVEGSSERTLLYYKSTVEHLFTQIETGVRKITTEEIRTYLSDYQKRNNRSNVTVDNVRRNISSFFSWLEEEDYILKSPMKRIHKIRTKTVVKNTISDEGIELLRDACTTKRDMAVIKLKDIADALDESMDEWEQFINIKTGKIISVPESPWTVGQGIYDELNAELEEAEDDFRMLPNQYEIREYNIMMDFALESGNDVVEAKHEVDDYYPPVSVKDTANAVRKIKKRGTDVVAISLDNDGEFECYGLLSEIYPNLIGCNDLTRLTGQLLGIIAKLIQ